MRSTSTDAQLSSRGARRARGLAAIAAGLALLALSTGEASADTVTLKDGRVIKGRVVDKGDAIHVEQKHGGMDFSKDDVLKVEFDDPLAGLAPRDDIDYVVLKNNKVLRGTVSKKGRKIYIQQDVGAGHVTVELDRDEVKTIRMRGKEKPEGTAGTEGAGGAESAAEAEARRASEAARREESLNSEVAKHVDVLVGEDEDAAEQSRVALIQLGIYAIPHLEREELQGGVRGLAATRVLRALQIREVVSSKLETAVPNLLRRITDGLGDDPSLTEDRLEIAKMDRRAERRRDAIREAVLMNAEDAPPLLVRLLALESHPEVKAFTVSQLAALRAYDPLLELLRTTDGQVRMAAALALGDDGVYVGIPVVIEALHLNRPEMRSLAIRKLEEWTGDTLGFDPAASEERRTASIQRWEEWWRSTGEARAIRSMRAARDSESVSAEDRATARLQWESGNEILDDLARSRSLTAPERRFQLEKAIWHFRKSLDYDPTLATARLSLAIIYLEEFGRADEARRELELLLTRFAPRGEEVARKTILLYLGRTSLVEGDLPRAEVRFAEALKQDPNFIAAHIGRGEVAFERATISGTDIEDAGADRPANNRREFLGQAVDRYEIALDVIRREQSGLHELIRDAQGPEGRSGGLTAGEVVQKARRSYDALNLKAADVLARQGRAYAALGDRTSALRAFREAKKLDDENPAYAAAIDVFSSPLPEGAEGETMVARAEDAPDAKRPGPNGAGGAGGATPAAPDAPATAPDDEADDGDALMRAAAAEARRRARRTAGAALGGPAPAATVPPRKKSGD